MFSLNLQFMSNHPIRDALIHRIKELSDHRGPDDPTLGQYIHFTDSLTYKTEDECYVISLDRDHELKWRALHLEYYSPFQEAVDSILNTLYTVGIGISIPYIIVSIFRIIRTDSVHGAQCFADAFNRGNTLYQSIFDYSRGVILAATVPAAFSDARHFLVFIALDYNNKFILRTGAFAFYTLTQKTAARGDGSTFGRK